jgi:hypothetical protein
MSTTAFIRRHVNGLRESQMFESFDLLIYGTRANVDFALKELVKKGRIVRLARGIYMRGDESTQLPSPEELASFKANCLGSIFYTLDGKELKDLKLNNNDLNSRELFFWVDGTGCSFMYGQFRITLKTIAPKKLRKLDLQRRLRSQTVLPRSKAGTF